MPTYNLNGGLISDTLLDQPLTFYDFASGALDDISNNITATTDGLMNNGTPYSAGQDIIDVGSTMTVNGQTYTITDELGSYGNMTYDDGTGAQTYPAMISHYTLNDGTDEIYVSFLAFEAGDPGIDMTNNEILGFTFDDDINTGVDLGLMPEYEDQGQLEFGGPQPSVPCFTAAMEIETEMGPVAAGNIEAGMMVKTVDHGLQEVKYVASRKVLAAGQMRPIVFEKGAIGNDQRLVVSQRHRFHVDALPGDIKSTFGPQTDCLIQANELCNGTTIHEATGGGMVEYVHLMFDDHQLVHCYGTVSESWQPTASALRHYPELAEELLAIFPGLDQRRYTDAGATVRPEVTIDPARIAKVRGWKATA